ncbi:MAG: DeoR/GlpR transcriptional regulator [Clostridiales bacterium]|nr:DeoR/GlpR transcriptional regulator [Clostridiales bacterium]
MKAERIWAINSYIQIHGEVHLKDLMKLYPNLSEMTLRRDIDYLESQGYVVRTRGGAKSIRRLTQIEEDAYSKRSIENADKKIEIGRKALKFFGNATCYYIDAGTTMMHLSKLLPEEPCFIVTNAPNIALELTRNPSANILLLGGNLNREHYSVSGASAVEQIKSINIDVAFIAASGFSEQSGFTNGNYNESELKRTIISRAKQSVLLMDSSKYDRILPFTFAEIGEIDYLISDSALPKSIIDLAKKHNTNVL